MIRAYKANLWRFMQEFVKVF